MVRVRALLYAVAGLALVALAALAVLRGSAGKINAHVLTYYVVNYGDGLIRRALVGEVFSWLASQKSFAGVQAAMVGLYTPLLVILLGGLLAWVAILEHRRRDFMLLALFAVFLTSQLVPTLAYDVGFLDVFDYILIAIAAAGFARRHHAVAGIAGFLGPFIHEAFIFCWFSLVAVVLWEQTTRLRIAVLLVPLISTFVIYFGASHDAAVAQITASVLPEADKEMALGGPLSQTLTASLDILLMKYRNYLPNALAAGAFYTLPAAVIIGLYGAARQSKADTAVLVGAAFAPLLILLLAWDLSRYLVGAVFYAFVAVLYMETVRPARPFKWPLPLAGWIASAFLVQVPFTYAYFEVAGIADVGPPSLRAWPIGRLTHDAVALYSRAVGPRLAEQRGNDPLPPGDVWYVEEDMWRGAWIRRPGTDMFDAVMTLPLGTVVTYTATVERDGDTIIARRNFEAGDALRMDYVGKLNGSAIRGTYAGGYWSAKIR